MEECPICLLTMKGTTNTQIGCCGKFFHEKCYTECMKVKPECPLCRAPQDDVRIDVPTVPPIILLQETKGAYWWKVVYSVVLVGTFMFFTYK